MTIFITLLLTVLTFAFIAYPLLQQRARASDTAGADKLRELASRRDTTYSMLKELEFDFQSGILTEEDYRDLETRYKRKAISILKDIDHSEATIDVEEEIEQQVRQLRQEKGQLCPQCGSNHQEGNRFCSQCGTNLRQGDSVD